MTDEAQRTVLIVVVYHVAVVLYVILIQKHLSVPRIINKFVIIDMPRLRNVFFQLSLAIMASYFLNKETAIAATIVSLLISVFLFFIFEVNKLVSPTSIIFQTIGMLMPTIYPGPKGMIIAIICLSTAVVVAHNKKYEKRYKKYITHLFRKYHSRYKQHLTHDDSFVQEVATSIMIVESMCRPTIFRALERIAKKLIYKTEAMSTGIMQVMANDCLSDQESINRAITMIERINNDLIKDGVIDQLERTKIIATKYNGDEEYLDYFLPIHTFVKFGSFDTELLTMQKLA